MPALDQRLIDAAAFLVLGTFMLFAMAMTGQQFNNVIRALVGSMFAVSALMLWDEFPSVFYVFASIGYLGCVWFYLQALRHAIRGDREKWKFIGATIFLMIGGAGVWVEHVLGISGGQISNLLVLWGSVTTALLLVFLLVQRIRLLQAENLRSARAAQLAQQETEDALHVADAKSAFLATMSHEIRTPMNGVLGMSDLLRESGLSSEQRDYVDTISRSGRSLMNILDDILDYSKFESGHIDLEDTSCDLLILIDDIMLTAREAIGERQVELLVLFEPDVPEVVRTDPTRLRQILMNLLSNAVKFTEQGQIRLRVQVDNAMLRFSVSDTGIGVPADQLPRLFQRFSQADSSVTRRFGGTGLGLAICKSLCQAMGGDIGAESTPGQGSKFEFRIPLTSERFAVLPPKLALLNFTGGSKRARSAAARFVDRWEVAVEPQADMVVNLDRGMRLTELRIVCCGRISVNDDDQTAPLAGLRILVAEDNTVNQMVAERTLSKLGAQVVVVEDGAQAVQRHARENFDVILMDCEMPVLDGYSATRQIRELERKDCQSPTPVIALSANATSDFKELAYESGMQGYIAKPFRRQELIETILQATAQH